MPQKLPPHVRRIKNRLGQEFFYLQRFRGTPRAEVPVRLPDFHDPEFWQAYAQAMRQPQPRIPTDDFNALIAAWKDSPEWAQMATSTQKLWGPYTARIAAYWGTFQVRGLEPKDVLILRDTVGKTSPAVANGMMRCLSSMLSWSVPRGWRKDNPCREIKMLGGGEPYEPWPWEIIEQARLELRPDLWWAVALAVYTGQRQGDVLRMRWDAIDRAGLIWVRQTKTRKDLAIPIHRDLQAVLATIPKRAVTILTNSKGRPWGTGFKATWAKERPAFVAEKGLVFHGLRKTAVVTLLEVGCSDAEVSSITGQSREMVAHYAQKVDQRRLARTAITRWEANVPGTSLVNTLVNTDPGTAVNEG